MKIEPPADDLGLQHLKATDRKAAADVARTDHVERSARIAPSAERREPTNPPLIEQRSGERRQQRRRQGDEPHPLDTREPHERRTRQRRETDVPAPSTDEESPDTGVDTTA